MSVSKSFQPRKGRFLSLSIGSFPLHFWSTEGWSEADRIWSRPPGEMAAAAITPAEIGPFAATSRAIHRLTPSEVEQVACRPLSSSYVR